MTTATDVKPVPETSPAPVTSGPIDLSTVSKEELAEYRKTGSITRELPKKQDTAPADAPKVESPEPEGETAAEPGTADGQDKPRRGKPNAEERIKQLTARVRELEGAPKKDAKVDPSTAKDQPSAPRSYPEWAKDFKPKVWMEQWSKDNPDASFEDAVSALTDHKLAVRDWFTEMQQLSKQLNEKMAKVKEKDPEADSIITPTSEEIARDPQISSDVKQAINDSEYFMDLLYVIGKDSTFKANFINTARTKPYAAMKALVQMEADIEAERKAPKTEEKEPAKEEPAKPEPRTFKPPAEVGGRGTQPADAAVEAARRNDYRAFAAEQTRRALAR